MSHCCVNHASGVAAHSADSPLHPKMQRNNASSCALLVLVCIFAVVVSANSAYEIRQLFDGQ
ncbi:hypothetical protein ACXWPL_09425, partial [Streptococcus pyogenes]